MPDSHRLPCSVAPVPGDSLMSPMDPTNTSALDDLVSALETEFAGEPRGARIAELLGEYAAAHEDWRPFALFAEDRYTRNLVARHERFELLLLCWDAGQESPIHNHEGQDCWMGVLEGDVEELRYCTPEEVVPGPLLPRDGKVFRKGQVAFIHDDFALHLVRGVGARRAVSLHLYAAPYPACSCYCPETGRVTRKVLSDYSVRGVLCTPEAASS